ncbi:TRAP transporter substrate-binding protein [Pseudooceanicola aestuarii]|uniref:TRAP transporter substrate-binding protein n=1 Tax=Pseudooceanicola aestuarii TaxID=2697319 RepID=UPI0013D0E16F|nr:TRAP transporter substrate-binding protein [Pseudooceanicola aestuarii]
MTLAPRTTLGALALATLAGPALAQTTLNLANEYQATTFAAVADEFFIDRVAELTEGSVTINYYPGGSLGFKSIDHFDAVTDGAIDIADTYIGQLSGIDPVFSMPSLPFLTTSKDEALKLETVLRPAYDEIFAKADQVYLFTLPWPPSGIWTNEALTGAADLAEMKVRVPDVTAMQAFKAAGANPLQVSWADIVPQLSTNALDAVISSAEGGTNISLGDFLPQYTALDYVIPVNVVHMNAMALENLTEEEQAAIRQAAAETSDFIWGKLEERLASTYDDLAELGVKVDRDVSPEVMETLKASSGTAMQDWLEKSGDQGQALLDAYRAAE